MASLGFPVPPGFIITTEVFRGYDAVVGYKYIFKDLSAESSGRSIVGAWYREKIRESP